jgi:hypothetical protein
MKKKKLLSDNNMMRTQLQQQGQLPPNVTITDLKIKLADLSVREKQLQFGLQQTANQYQETFQQIQQLQAQVQVKLDATKEQMKIQENLGKLSEKND